VICSPAFILAQICRSAGFDKRNCAILGLLIVKSVSLHSSVEQKRLAAPLLYLPGNTPVYARKQQKKLVGAEVYCLQRTPVDFYPFDEEYLTRLGARDPATEAHFVAYFSERLKITLRARGVDAQTIEDIRQETFCRVWTALLAGSVNNPRGFGSYVHSVCRNVLSETRRGDHRNQHDSLDSTDIADEKLSLEDLMQRKENERLVRAILSELPERDRQLLQARFFEDRDNDEICEDFSVDRNYLRVLLHRATNKFGELYRKKSN
jgi:RNA polymerase sigma-70 factor, ECF subfamily